MMMERKGSVTMEKVVERIKAGFIESLKKLNAFFERCEAFGKRHAAGTSWTVHILERAKRYLVLIILFYVALTELDGYRYLLSVDTTHTALYTLGVLIRCFILPVGTFVGLLDSVGSPFRPVRRFLSRIVKGVAMGILITAAATGFLGYCLEYSVVIVVFACMTAAWLLILILENLLRFLFLEGTEGQSTQLSIENAQLRTVIEQFDPGFFSRKCRVCGCDWNHPCEGGCFWEEDDLCSKCSSKQRSRHRKDGAT